MEALQKFWHPYTAGIKQPFSIYERSLGEQILKTILEYKNEGMESHVLHCQLEQTSQLNCECKPYLTPERWRAKFAFWEGQENAVHRHPKEALQTTALIRDKINSFSAWI